MNSKSNHIVHIVPNLILGGVPKLVLGIAKFQIQANNSCSVICLLKSKGELASAFASSDISVFTSRVQWPSRLPVLPASFREWIRQSAEKTFSLRLSCLLKRIKADVVHTHSARSIDLVAESVINKCQLPLVWSIHAFNPYLPGPQMESVEKAILIMKNSGRGIITTDSSLLAQDFLSHFPYAEQFLKIVHPGADVQGLLSPIIKDESWKKNLGIPKDSIVYGSCGRLAHVKGFDIFIRAASILVEQSDLAYFVISGKGESFDELKTLINSLGLQSRFLLLGFQENLKSTLNQFDVFVLSSRSEGFPLSLIEALAAGLPCIATDVSGVDEMLGECGGIIVPKESPGDLAMAMNSMLDPDIRENYSIQGRLQGSKYSYNACSSEYLKIYSSLLLDSSKAELLSDKH